MTLPTDFRVTLWMAYLAIGALLVVAYAALETGSLSQSLLSSEPVALGVARLEPGAG